MLQSKTHFNTTSAFVLNSLSIFLFFSVCLQIIAGLLIYAQLVFENWFSLWDCFLVIKETIFEFPDWLKKVSFCEKFLKTCLFHKKWEKNSGKVEENSGNGRKHSENSKKTQKLGKKTQEMADKNTLDQAARFKCPGIWNGSLILFSKSPTLLYNHVHVSWTK